MVRALRAMGFYPRRCEKGGGGVRGGRIWGPGGGGCCRTAAVRPPSASSLLVPPPRRALQGTWPPWLLEPLFMTLWALFYDSQPIFVTLRAPFCTTLGALFAQLSEPFARTQEEVTQQLKPDRSPAAKSLLPCSVPQTSSSPPASRRALSPPCSCPCPSRGPGDAGPGHPLPLCLVPPAGGSPARYVTH